MLPLEPFDPTTAKTYAVVGGTAAAGTGRLVGNSASASEGLGKVPMLVYNSDTANDAWLAWGTSAADAQTNVVTIPVAGTPQYMVPLPAGSLQTLNLPLNKFYAVYGVAGTPTIYMTPGKGG